MPTLQSVPTLQSIMDDLHAKGSEKTRAVYARHGMPADRSFGVSNADLKLIAKTIKREQALAMELYATGNLDAMYLAGLVADGSQMTRKQLQSWADGAAGMHMIFEYTVPWVAVESAFGPDLAAAWIKSNQEHVAAAGWCTYSGLAATKPDTQLDLALFERLLGEIESGIATAKNRVKSTMNRFVISVGSYVVPLHEQAMATGKRLGPVAVDVGDTDCKVPLATEYMEKVKALGKLGQKRKTIRC
jgi:3-methyladenine DNA glycosylase AlkD